MTHQRALSENQIDRSDCTGEKCLATVFTVEGGVHWWNFEGGEPSEHRREKQEQMRADRARIGGST